MQKRGDLMRKISLFCVILLLLVNTSLYANPTEDTLIQSDEVLRTVVSINNDRQALNLDPLFIKDELKEMSLTHSKYMYHNDSVSSIEESDLLYYRGRYPWDRADYAMYDKNFVYEYVGIDYVNYLEGYSEMISNPVTRYAALNPMYTDIGMGVYENCFTFDFGGNQLETEQAIIYLMMDKQMLRPDGQVIYWMWSTMTTVLL